MKGPTYPKVIGEPSIADRDAEMTRGGWVKVTRPDGTVDYQPPAKELPPRKRVRRRRRSR